jgi:hypothetical protein
MPFPPPPAAALGRTGKLVGVERRRARSERDAGGTHLLARRGLVAHQRQDLGRRADED